MDLNWDLKNHKQDIYSVGSDKKIKPKLDHELRSALHSLLGYLEIYQNETVEALDENQIYLLNRIIFFANQLTNLIDEAIDLLRDNNIIKS